MKKEKMILKNYELTRKIVDNLEELKRLSGESRSYHVRKALNNYLPKELKKYNNA